jgi:hypothetical protein
MVRRADGKGDAAWKGHKEGMGWWGEGWCFGERGHTYGGIHTCMEWRRLQVVPAVWLFGQNKRQKAYN